MSQVDIDTLHDEMKDDYDIRGGVRGKYHERYRTGTNHDVYHISRANVVRDHTPQENSVPTPNKITPCLWFDHQAEEAARFYTSVFRNSKIGRITRYGEAGHEIHGMPAGSVLTVDFELDGQRFTALNGGPAFQFNEAISLQIDCATQDEVDYYWDKLTAGGDEAAQQCGWLKDRYGVSWQVVPSIVAELIGDPDSEKSERAMEALLQTKKLDIEALKRAHAG